jgi:hypothetical protein
MIYETLIPLWAASLLDARRQSIETLTRMAATAVLARLKGNARGEAKTV